MIYINMKTIKHTKKITSVPFPKWIPNPKTVPPKAKINVASIILDYTLRFI